MTGTTGKSKKRQIRDQQPNPAGGLRSKVVFQTSKAFSFFLLQTLVYSGMRIGACSKLRCSDVVKSTTDVGDHYTIEVVKGKGGKSRNVPLKQDIDKSLHQLAQQQAKKGSIWGYFHHLRKRIDT